ncbi:MAG: 4-(cytidine 5'-diphospho)-2-C-methyl-D-erythritol kinase, partial [Eubacteriales bacterium]|nr:4-(cytidine 5'-diphospho)-2-C-methyl-D-erythritol kinase [Eubacteriales bacterium]
MGEETSITVFSYAKINLSLDVGPVRPDGYHPVDMIMQQLLFHDDVRVSFEEGKVPGENLRRIVLSSSSSDVPKDSRNLAWRAAELLSKRAGTDVPEGTVRIEIVKRIPVAAGLAGGSGNGAAVLHALNALWKLNLSFPDLMKEGAKLGADVPFCVMGQAAGNLNLPENIRTYPAAASAARATGIGTILSPVHSRRMPLVFAKPEISVSTAEVFRG